MTRKHEKYDIFRVGDNREHWAIIGNIVQNISFVNLTVFNVSYGCLRSFLSGRDCKKVVIWALKVHE